VLLDVDVRGGRRLMKKYPGGIFIFIEPPDNRTLVDRLNRRNTEKPADIDRRLSTARRELRLRRYYSYRVKNDDLPSAIKEVSAIINRAITAGGR
jgi:guanylate kinase